MRSLLMMSALLCVIPGCKQALGDPCDASMTCEVGLVCDSGRCVPPPPPSSVASVPVVEQIEIDGLSAPVDVILDEWGTPHVYATSLADAWAAVGFFMARDRAAQLEIARRTAAGELAPVVGDAVEDAAWRDVMARLLGLEATAAASWGEIDAGSPDAQALTGFAQGVTVFLERARDGAEPVDEPVAELLEHARAEWTPIDSLAVAQLELLRATWIADRELELHLLLERSDREFVRDASADFELRRGFGEDMVRFAPAVETTAPLAPPATGARSASPAMRPTVDSPLFSDGWVGALEAVRDLAGASSDRSAAWVASGEMSQGGGGLMAVSLSGPLGAPPLVYPVHLVVEGDAALNAAGLCPVGVPELVSGFNRDVAWTRVASGADLVDLYFEQISTTDGGAPAVVLGDALVPIEPLEVTVETATGLGTLETGRVPHHGPFVPHLSDGAMTKGWGDLAGLTVRWDGVAPRRALAASSAVIAARTAREVADIVGRWSTTSAAWLVTDRHGATALVGPRCVPRRPAACLSSAPARGGYCAPFTVLPGGGNAEWEPCDAAPGDLSTAVFGGPGREFIIAAGADLTGATFDGDPFSGPEPYLGWSFEAGYRTARLEELLASHGNRRRMSLDDAARTLVDDRSAVAAALMPALRHAVERGRRERETSGSEPDLMRLINQLGSRFEKIEQALALLEAWDGAYSAGDETSAAAPAAAIAGSWLPRLFDAVLGDELEELGVSLDDDTALRSFPRLFVDGAVLRTQNLTLGQSTLFDDLRTRNHFESRDERLLVILDETIAWLEETLGTEMTEWRWGEIHRVTLPGLPIADGGWGTLGADDGGLPVPGGPESLWGCDPALPSAEPRRCDAGPGARLVAETTPSGPQARVVLAGDQRGGPGQARELELWRSGGMRRLRFSLVDVLDGAVARVRLVPAAPSP